MLDKLANKETIIRNALIFLNRSKRRKEIFDLVNGKFTGFDIANKLNIAQSNCLNELALLRDVGLIHEKKMRGRSIIYEKEPFIKRLNLNKYFTRTNINAKERLYFKSSSGGRVRKISKLAKITKISDLKQILKEPESQTIDFKEKMIAAEKLKKIIVAFSNTKNGGNVIFGIRDGDRTIVDLNGFQKAEEFVQNICRDGIDPPIVVDFNELKIDNKNIFRLFIPPKPNDRTYRVKNGSFYIRIGSTIREPTHDELKTLFNGKYIV